MIVDFVDSIVTSATMRTLISTLHLLLRIPNISFISGPLADIPAAAFAARIFFGPVVMLTGFGCGKGMSFGDS